MVFSCRPDWSLIASLPQRQGGSLAATLEQLQLVVNDHMERCLTSEEYDELLKTWRDYAKMWLPQVDLMLIRLADDREEAFVDALFPPHEEEDSDEGGSPTNSAEEVSSTYP